jgi:isopentenyl phosphate kinase
MVDEGVCIIKIGGAAITKKDTFETLNPELLDHFAEHVIKPLTATKKVILIHGTNTCNLILL